MSDGMGRELAYLSSHATNRYFIPNWGIEMILDSFSLLPDEVEHLVNNSFLTDKMKRTYLRIVKERIQRFNRKSE